MTTKTRKPLSFRTLGEKVVLSVVVIGSGVMGVWAWRQYIQPTFRPPAALGAGQDAPGRIGTEPAGGGLPSVGSPDGVRVVYGGAGLRDPLASLLPTEQLRAGAAAQQAAPPPMALRGIIWSEAQPQAIIDRQVVRPGDTVLGAEVISIKRDGVTLLYRGRTIQLKLLRQGNAHYPEEGA
ncbi:MAG: hypothetical protein HY597_01455 [Candidatus Omnitrophica bacterium]|nr:hypothetical protein [Candidatus Omnitrophota bacterium]